jgi:prepilin-type N-terminal cleavage/methylation domain-containing protein
MIINPAAERRGFTLVEMCVALILLSALLEIGIPRLRLAVDRAAVRGAVQEASALFTLARRSAMTRRAVVAVVIDTVGGGFVIRSGSSVIARRNIRSAFGVRVASSRDSMSYDPRGLGYGAANLTVSASRGKAAETLFVSRLGRVRH